MNRDNETPSWYDYVYQTNGKRSQTNRDKKSNLLFLQRHYWSPKFQFKLVKNRLKALQRD